MGQSTIPVSGLSVWSRNLCLLQVFPQALPPPHGLEKNPLWWSLLVSHKLLAIPLTEQLSKVHCTLKYFRLVSLTNSQARWTAGICAPVRSCTAIISFKKKLPFYYPFPLLFLPLVIPLDSPTHQSLLELLTLGHGHPSQHFLEVSLQWGNL